MSLADTTIAVIGAGHLGSSILRRLSAQGHQHFLATRRTVSEFQKLQNISSSLRLTADNASAAKEAGIILLTTKQTSFEQIAKEIRDSRKGKLLISLGPTYQLAKVGGMFGGRNARVMMPVDPSTDVLCYATDTECEARDDEAIRYIFGDNVHKVPEDTMPAATAITLLRGVLNSFVDPLVESSIMAGMEKSLAQKMIGMMLTSAGGEIARGVQADERLGNASGGFNDQSYTMKLHKDLALSREILLKQFEKACRDFEKQ